MWSSSVVVVVVVAVCAPMLLRSSCRKSSVHIELYNYSLFDTDIQYFVMSLGPRLTVQKEQRINLLARNQKLLREQIQIVPAVNGHDPEIVINTLVDSQLVFHHLDDVTGEFPWISWGALGCWLSKYKVFLHQVRHEIPYTVLLEDDVLVLPEFEAKLMTMIGKQNSSHDQFFVPLACAGEGYVTSLGSAKLILQEFYSTGITSNIQNQLRKHAARKSWNFTIHDGYIGVEIPGNTGDIVETAPLSISNISMLHELSVQNASRTIPQALLCVSFDYQHVLLKVEQVVSTYYHALLERFHAFKHGKMSLLFGSYFPSVAVNYMKASPDVLFSPVTNTRDDAVQYFVISLGENLTAQKQLRLNLIQENNATLEGKLQVAPAINGRDRNVVMQFLSASGLDFHHLTPTDEELSYISWGALACWCAKYRVLLHQVRNRIPYVVMLEDDVAVHPGFAAAVKDMITLFKNDDELNLVRLAELGEGYVSVLCVEWCPTV